MVFALALLSVQAGWLSYATWLALAAVFITDATVMLLTRLLRGERWYEAHRNHAYQKLTRRWGGHRPVTLLAVGINVLWLAPLAGACAAWPQWAFGWVRGDQSVNLVLYRVDSMVVYPFFALEV